MKLIQTAVVICLGLAAQMLPVAASPEADLLFATRHFEGTPDAAVLTYRRDRGMKAENDEGTLKGGERIDLTIGADESGKRWIDVVIDPEGRPRRYDRFTGLEGNPMLMVFLEGVVKSVQNKTGGSPFYLRNRIKESLASGIDRRDIGAAKTTLTLRPFARADARARLGPYADLTLVFEMDRKAPGMLTVMSAKAGDAYSEEIRLVPTP